LGIKQSYLIIIISVVVVGAISSSLFVIVDLQSQVEELSKETKQQQSQLEAELAVKEQQQRELEEQQRELEREEAIRLQQQRELEEQERQLKLEEGIRLQQQRELEEQERQLELQKRAQIEEMARTNPLVKGLIDGQLKFYIEPVPAYAASQVDFVVTELTKILENYEFYKNVNFKRVYNPNDAHIHISWIKNYGSHVLGESIFKSVVKVGLGAENCYGDWQPFTAHTVMKIFWHEIGHSMGFGHSNNPDNIMYDNTETKLVTDYHETIALDEGEYITLPFCSGGTMQYQASSEDKYNGFHVYVFPPETDPTNFIENGIGLYYSDCSTENPMVKFGYTCNVANGAKLVIYNPDDILNFDVIRVDTTISDLNEVKNPKFIWEKNIFEYDDAWLNEIWYMFH